MDDSTTMAMKTDSPVTQPDVRPLTAKYDVRGQLQCNVYFVFDQAAWDHHVKVGEERVVLMENLIAERIRGHPATVEYQQVVERLAGARQIEQQLRSEGQEIDSKVAALIDGKALLDLSNLGDKQSRNRASLGMVEQQVAKLAEALDAQARQLRVVAEQVAADEKTKALNAISDPEGGGRESEVLLALCGRLVVREQPAELLGELISLKTVFNRLVGMYWSDQVAARVVQGILGPAAPALPAAALPVEPPFTRIEQPPAGIGQPPFFREEARIR
jgi:hypothetical protein